MVKMKQWIGIAMVAVMIGGAACASAPPETPDSEKIRQNADESYESLEQEEKR